jgi:2-hydroxychromene-2-carboxylate isomerase
MAEVVEFWFEYASTYSHIAAHRIEGLAAQRGLSVLWRPFMLAPIFNAQGWRDSPFNIYPAKGANMWRDMERECARFGLAFRRPSRFPRNGLSAARITLAAEDEAWTPAFVKAVYQANFVHDQEIGEPEVLRALLAQAGCPAPEAAFEAGEQEEIKQRLRARGEEAAARGLYGAPSVLVGEELFWGADRLEQALDWACAG